MSNETRARSKTLQQDGHEARSPTASLLVVRPALPGYKDYIASTDSHPKDPERQRVVRLEARWQLARSYDGLRLVSRHDRRTVRGYEALLRVTLAYSTIDQFQEACGPSLAYIEDQDLAGRLRNSLDIEAIRENEKTSRMKRGGAFDDIATTKDVAVFARALRHMFTHGSGTPWGVDAKTKDAIAALTELSERLLVEVEQGFKAWVDARLVAQRGKELEIPVQA